MTKESIHEKRVGEYVEAYSALHGKAPSVCYYSGGFYYIAGNQGISPTPYRSGKVEEMTARLRYAVTPEGKMKRALAQGGFRLCEDPAGNESFRFRGSAAEAIATNAKGDGKPAPGDWALVVYRNSDPSEPDTDIQHDDSDPAYTFEDAARLCVEIVETVSKAERVQDAAAKLAAEYESECNPNRADEVRRAFAMLPECSAAKLYDLMARNF